MILQSPHNVHDTLHVRTAPGCLHAAFALEELDQIVLDLEFMTLLRCQGFLGHPCTALVYCYVAGQDPRCLQVFVIPLL